MLIECLHALTACSSTCCVFVVLSTASQQPDAAEREAAAVADLQAQAAQLKQQLQDKNQAIKQVINKLRHMIDAFNMWESHRRHLTQHAVQYAAAGTGSML